MTGNAAHLCALADADVAQDGGRGTNQDIVADLGMPVAMHLARACARTRGPEVQHVNNDLRITTAHLQRGMQANMGSLCQADFAQPGCAGSSPPRVTFCSIETLLPSSAVSPITTPVPAVVYKLTCEWHCSMLG